MDTDPYSLLHGETVRLHASYGPLAPCMKCGGKSGEVMPGIATHPLRMRCAGCGHNLGWLGRNHADALLSAHKAKA